MRKTLWSRLILCFLISGVMFFILLNNFGVQLFKKQLKQDQISLLIRETELIESDYLGNLLDDTTPLDNLTLQFRALNRYQNIRVWIVNRTGEIILDSMGTKNPSEINLNEISPGFLYGHSIQEDIIFKGIFHEPMLSYIRPINSDFKLRGYVILHTPMSKIDQQALVYFDVINICFLIFSPLLFLIFIYIYYITYHPMNRLILAAKEYSLGNYSHQLTVNGVDEFHDLGDTISYMAGELSTLEEYQKKFVANISHDFRSPLTSIKGYAEAILDGTIPHEMQDKYLNIILFETERLTKLTSSLLELNRFDNKGAMVDICSFDINHTIKKTAETFEGACRTKKITLNLVFSSQEIFVNADMDKIQQVLYNLLDNAIKFSHNNSNIKVTAEEKGDKVFISVRDYGIGIPKESIKKIWERFYKTDQSRGKDRKGTGLGLSIAREIILAHNENINVISTEGVGTEFIFSLPKS